MSEILIITNLQHAASRIWTSAEPEFRIRRMKLDSIDNHYTLVLWFGLKSSSLDSPKRNNVFETLCTIPSWMAFLLKFIGW